MKRQTLKVFLFISLLSGMSSSIYSENTVSGKWRCVGRDLADEDVVFVLDLKQTGGTVTGTATTDETEIQIQQGTIDGNKMEFVTEAEGVRYTSNVIIDNDKLKATWKDSMSRSGTWTGERIK